MRRRMVIEIILNAAFVFGVLVFTAKGLLFAPFFCLGVIVLRAVAIATGATAVVIRLMYIPVLLYAAFKIFGSFGVLGYKAIFNISRGFGFVPEAAAASLVIAAALPALSALKRKFKWYFIIDAIVFLIFTTSALEVAFQHMPFFAGNISNHESVIFSHRDRGFNYGVLLTENGTRAIYTSRGDPNRVTVCEIESGRCESTPLDAGDALRMKLDPAGGTLYVSHDGSKVPPLGEESPLRAFTKITLDADFRPTSRAPLFATASMDFSLDPGGTLSYVTRHMSALRIGASDGSLLVRCSLPFQPFLMTRNPVSGKYYTGSLNGTVGELDPASMCATRTLDLGLSIGSLVVEPASRKLYAASILPGGISIINLDTWEKEGFIPLHYFTRELAILPARNRLIAADYRRGRVSIINLATGKTIRELSFGKMLRQLSADPESGRVAAVSYLGVFVFDSD
ncbi:MAG TPA: hypothetical protein PLN69_04970 [bacterium]|nr:hypothetical protein [bacterium]